MGLNPLKRVNSILTNNGKTQNIKFSDYCLNPLKRVNSILTVTEPIYREDIPFLRSQSPQTGQFNSYK